MQTGSSSTILRGSRCVYTSPDGAVTSEANVSRQEFAGKRVAIYARFSSQMQREASLDDQVRRCTAYVTDRGGMVRSELVFKDSAVSGTSMQRRDFERMMSLVDATPRAVDVIVTEDMSRISRD